jgi:DNA-binding MarR family transcriptional regulator
VPVHLDTHEPDVALTPGTAKSDIVAFLYNNSELGFKPKELEDHLELPHGTVTTTLSRLYNDGLVGKTRDSHYHALEHREDLRRYVASLDQLNNLFEDKEYAGPQTDDVDEDELDAEIAELEAEIEDA